MSVSLIVDANGTDWFDIQGASDTSTSYPAAVTFLAYPVNPVAPANIPRIVVSATAPPTPVLNDLWVDTT